MSAKTRPDRSDIAQGTPVTGRRWIYAGAGLAAMLMLGLFYAWSIFVPPLEEEFGWSRSQTSLTFSISLTAFCLGGFSAGIIAKKLPPRVVMLGSGAMISLGLIAASRAEGLAMMHLCYGGLAGFGIGMGYNAILNAMLKWFPDKLGFISGILLMGFGSGGMLIGGISAKLVAEFGWRDTFLYLGIFYAAGIFAASLLTVPPKAALLFPAAKARGKKAPEQGLELSAGQMLRRPSFFLLFIWGSTGTGAGMMLLGHAAPLILSINGAMSLAVFLAGVVSACNGVSRVFSGLNLDLNGRAPHMRAASCGLVLGALLLAAAVKTGSTAVMGAAFVVTGLAYGGYLPTFATVIMLFYGKSNYAMNLGLFNLNNMVASIIGPFLGGLLHTWSGSYGSMSVAMLCIALLSLAMTFLIRKP